MEKFLIIQTAFPGDAILTLPMLQKLKQLNPGCPIDVVAIPATKDIFSHSPAVDNVWVLDKRNRHKSLFKLSRFAKELKKNNYTRIYSPHRSFRTSLLVTLLNVRETYGFDTSSFAYVYKNMVKYERQKHEVERNLDLIGFNYGEGEWRIPPEMSNTPEEKNRVNDYINEFGGVNKLAAVAPGSVWKTKMYPAEYFIEIIKFLRQKNYTVILLGGSGDKEICAEIAAPFTEGVVSAAGAFTIPESVQLLRSTGILICNDSAPTHMGMAAGIPVLTLYCSTVSRFGFFPYNFKSKYLSFDDLFCKPCGIHGYNECPIKTFECAYKLLPETVNKVIEEMLDDR